MTDRTGLALLLIPLAGVSVWWGTALVRRYAIRMSLIDVPNERSSHFVATPRGGGVAIAVVVLAVVLLQAVLGRLDPTVAYALLGGGGLVAIVGFADDHRDVAAGWRALVQFAAATWLVYWVGGPGSVSLGPWTVPLGPAGPILAVVGLVWLTNLFNFMDGIDGLAAAETIAVATTGALFLAANGMTGVAVTCLAIAAATAGFLRWNWPPATIFMGDTGSAFLGFTLGGIVLTADSTGAIPVVAWILLLGVFLFDATVTLLRRLPRESVYKPHRRHAYQRAVAAGWSHGKVTVCITGLNVVLALLAAIAVFRPVITPLAVLAGAVLLSCVYLFVERRRPMWSEPDSTSGSTAGPAVPIPDANGELGHTL